MLSAHAAAYSTQQIYVASTVEITSHYAYTEVPDLNSVSNHLGTEGLPNAGKSVYWTLIRAIADAWLTSVLTTTVMKGRG